MRSFRHWTADYVWKRSRNIVSNFAHSDWPWLTPQAVRFLDLWLKPTDVVFEWGSGRSTLWIARRVRRIASVEHDPAWFGRVRSKASRQNLDNIELKLYPDGQDSPGEARYVSAIHEVSDNFDLVVVDGLARDQCALAAIPKLNAGGLLLIDNGNWYLPSSSRAPCSCSPGSGPASPQWTQFACQVSAWRVIWTTNGVTDTVIWVKPNSAIVPSSPMVGFRVQAIRSGSLS